MKNDEEKNEIFEEYNVLESTMKDISENDFTYEEIFLKFKNISLGYNKLLKLTQELSQISDLHEKELKKNETELKNILDNSNQGFLVFDKNYVISPNYSSECIKIFDKNVGNLNILDVIKSNDTEKNNVFEKNFENIFKTSDNKLIKKYIAELPEMVIINEKYIEIKYKTIDENHSDEDKFLMMMILTDITEKVNAQKQVEYLSYHDKLTSLHNRTYLEKNMTSFTDETNFPCGVIFGDMNGLKLTNDVFGHQKGDELIVLMSTILKQCCWDNEVIVRWAGDEFVIIVSKATQEICDCICKRIKLICDQAKWDPIGPSISLGIAIQESVEVNFSELFDIAEKNMYKKKIIEGREIKRQIIFSMGKILKSRCFEGHDHIERIRALAVDLGKSAGVLNVPSETQAMELLATLHDVGKIAIPTEILGKVTPLGNNDWETIKNHSEVGFRMIQAINEPEIATEVLYIHERWDGTGYPEGLTGNQIPIQSRIMAIVEAFDVMTRDRIFKKAISKDEAIQEIKRCSGTQFDPSLVELFLGLQL